MVHFSILILIVSSTNLTAQCNSWKNYSARVQKAKEQHICTIETYSIQKNIQKLFLFGRSFLCRYNRLKMAYLNNKELKIALNT